jgi:hypothetical protein
MDVLVLHLQEHKKVEQEKKGDCRDEGGTGGEKKGSSLSLSSPNIIKETASHFEGRQQ